MTYWTPEHKAVLLPVLLVALYAALLLRILFRRAPIWVRMIPMQLLSLTLIALEMQKQSYALEIGYDNKYLPFHFCSLFLVVLPLASFYFGKGAETLRSLALTILTTVSVVTLIIPDEIFSQATIQNFETDFLSCHTVIFHCIIPIFCIMMIALDVCRPRIFRDLAVTLVAVVLYSMLAARMSERFDANFSNFLKAQVEELEEIRLEIVAEKGEELGRRIYVQMVGSVHVAANLIGCTVGSILACLSHLISFGASSRSQK